MRQFLLQTLSAIFQLGIAGPKLKNNSGVVEARNSADNAFTKVRCADPAASNDAVTKGYADTNYGGSNVVKTLRKSVTTSTVDFADQIPANATVMEVDCKTTSAYDTGTIKVGNATTADAYMEAAYNDPTVVGNDYVRPNVAIGSSAVTPRITITGSPTTGAATVLITYSVPLGT